MGTHVTDYTLYRWRYILGYGLIGLTIAVLLAIAGLYIPGGLSVGEQQSVVTSSALSFSLDSFDPSAIINLPYHLLQRASIELFGLSPLAIKLPSLLLGLATAAGILILLRMWFRANVAIITTVLVVTTGQFLFVAQSGTENIMYLLLSTWLLVAALKVSRKAKFSGLWKISLFVIAALSLYTPLSIHILIALLSAIILHPHLRFIVRRLSKVKLLIAGAVALIITIPLIYAIWKDQSIGLTLLGIPETMPNIGANAIQLIKQYIDFLTPNSSALMSPIYSLGSMILILLGILRLVTTKYTARSYITAAWIVLLLPVLILNPDYVSVTFVPVFLLMAMGIHTLLSNWYKLFPRNPYARIAGLIPLAVLIGGLIFSGIDRYVYGYLYAPQTASNFSQDLRILSNELNKKDRAPAMLVAAADEKPFYEVIAKYNDKVSVVSSIPEAPAPLVIASRKTQPQALPIVPYGILTDATAGDSDRFYIYKTDAK